MKTAFLFGSLNRGGTETLLLDVCRNLGKEDFEAIGVYRKEGILETSFIESGVPFFKLTPGKNKITYLWKLRTLLHAQKVDIVHAQQPIDALYAKIACLFTNKKIVLTLHGFDSGPEKRKSNRLKFILRSTRANVYVSNYLRDYYVDRYKLQPRKQWVVYNGIDTSKIDVTDNMPFLRRELKTQSNTLLLGMVGNFNEVRDQFTVCRFLDLLNREGGGFPLCVCRQTD